VLDPATLEQVGSFATPLQPLAGSEPYEGRGVTARLVFDPHHPRAFLLANREARYETNNPGGSRIDIIDLGTYAIAGGGDLGMQVGPSDLVVVPRPPVPAALVADVTGARVTLRWSRGEGPGLAVGYRVEAGSAPGLANIARFELGTANELVVDPVPSGAYYVRVRGTNWAGVSDASTEIVVTVPWTRAESRLRAADDARSCNFMPSITSGSRGCAARAPRTIDVGVVAVTIDEVPIHLPEHRVPHVALAKADSPWPRPEPHETKVGTDQNPRRTPPLITRPSTGAHASTVQRPSTPREGRRSESHFV